MAVHSLPTEVRGQSVWPESDPTCGCSVSSHWTEWADCPDRLRPWPAGRRLPRGGARSDRHQAGHRGRHSHTGEHTRLETEKYFQLFAIKMATFSFL